MLRNIWSRYCFGVNTITDKQHDSEKSPHLECVVDTVSRPLDVDHLCDAHLFDLLQHKFTIEVQLFLQDINIFHKF